MDAISEHNKKYQFFADITSEAMKVHHKFHPGLLESAYEAALAYLLGLRGMKVERQVFLPIYWDDVQLDQTYRMDLVVNDHRRLHQSLRQTDFTESADLLHVRPSALLPADGRIKPVQLMIHIPTVTRPTDTERSRTLSPTPFDFDGIMLPWNNVP